MNDLSRRPSRKEVHKKNALAVLVALCAFAVSLIAWRIPHHDFELWIAGWMITGTLVAFFVALLRGESF